MRSWAVLVMLSVAAGCGTTLPRSPGEVGVRQQRADMERVSGSIAYRALAALPRPGQLRVVLQEEGGEEYSSVTIAEQSIDIVEGVAPPFPFTISYDRAQIDRARTYVIRAEVRDAGGDLRFATENGAPVITRGAPTREVQLSLAGASESAVAPPSAYVSPRDQMAAAPVPAQDPVSLAPPTARSRRAAAAAAAAPPPPAPVDQTYAPPPPSRAARAAASVAVAPSLVLPAPGAAVVAPSVPVPRAPRAQQAAATPAAQAPRAAGAAPGTPGELRFDRIDFRAIGPDWILDLYPNRMDLSYGNGGRRVEVARPIPIQPSWPGLIYQARLGDRMLVVTIRRETCRITATGETYPSRVTVEIDGQTLEGCGRAV